MNTQESAGGPRQPLFNSKTETVKSPGLPKDGLQTTVSLKIGSKSQQIHRIGYTAFVNTPNNIYYTEVQPSSSEP